MGSGNYACYEDVIEESFIKEVAGEELDVFIIFLENNNSSLEGFADSIKYDECPDEVEDDEECIKLWENLQKKFKEETGLDLRLNYHNAEDRGDEVDGYFWCVDGVYIYTLSGEKYKDKIIRKNWTIFG